MRKHKRLNLVGGGKLPGRERSCVCLNSRTPFPDDVFEPWRREGDRRQYRLGEESLGRVKELVRARSLEIVSESAGLSIKKDDDIPFGMRKEEDDAVIAPILDALAALHVPPSEEINTSSYDRIQKLLREYRASPLPPITRDSRRKQNPNERWKASVKQAGGDFQRRSEKEERKRKRKPATLKRQKNSTTKANKKDWE